MLETTEQQLIRKRGRPKKIKTPAEILAELMHLKRGRGRPKKIKTREEILAEMARPKRGRGRPKKILTPAEILAQQLRAKRGRGRPKKNTLSHEEMLIKVLAPIEEKILEQKIAAASAPKNIQSEKKQNKLELDEKDLNFIFPIYEELLKRANVSALTNSPTPAIKQKKKKSPHLLNLRNSYPNLPTTSSQPTFTPPFFPAPYYNPDNWFANFNAPYFPYQTEYLNEVPAFANAKTKLDFELPTPTELQEKIKFHKPKEKTRRGLKLDIGSEMLYHLNAFSPRHRKTKAAVKPFFYPFKLFWQIIAAPFKLLDFIVDRTLRGIFLLIKYALLSLINLFKSIFLNLKLVLKGQPAKVSSIISLPSLTFKRYNLKPIFTFIIICLIIILPFQISAWYAKTKNLKGQVLGKSMLGLEALKNASLLGQNFDFEQAETEFGKAYFNFSLSQNYLQNIDVVSQQLIKIIPETAAAENLLLIGQLAAKTGEELSALVKKIQPDSGQPQSLTDKLSALETTLKNTEPLLLELSSRLDQLEIDKLKKYLTQENLQQFSTFQSTVAVFKQNFNHLKTLNDFLLNFFGQKSSRTYLVVFQNNSELRPTGGFMGSFALVEIKNGKIVKMDVPGGGFYDLKAANQTLVEAPKPFQLFSPTWQIWNANWFADWPASAEKIAWFYEKTINGMTLDGVIALTPELLEDLLTLTGPIKMAAYNKTLDEKNLVRELQLAVEVEYDKKENQPKQIIADLLPQILDKIFNLSTKEAPDFLSLLNKNLAEKNILFWFRDDNLQSVVKNFGWAGEIKNNQSDYLMVVHTNIGGGKTDRVIENKISHTVAVQTDGHLIDTVKLTRTHQGKTTDLFENQNNVDYLRFYVPTGSRLLSAEGFDEIPSNLFKVAENQKIIETDPQLEKIEKNPILDEKTNTRITEEFGKTCFGNWLQIKPGEEKTVAISYELPFSLKQGNHNLFNKIADFILATATPTNRYNLIIQKQAGVASTDFESQFILPTDWQLINRVGKNTPVQNNHSIFYQDDLRTDGYYGIEMK